MPGPEAAADLVRNPKSDWVRRVLGVDVPAQAGTAPDARGAIMRAVAEWNNTTQEVGRQVESLRKVLLASTDPELHRIAEFGLNGITGKLRVGLETALREVAVATPDARPNAAAKVAQAAAALRGFLATDRRIAACDACPTVPVSLRATFSAGLDSLDRMLKAAA